MKFFTYCSSQPSLKIFLNTLPRSGSKYLAHTLADALRMSRMVISLQRLGDDLLVPKWVETFSRGGYLAKEHLPALRSNLVLLRHFGVTRFVVHVRDPRQSILSLTRFLENQMERTDASYRFPNWQSFWEEKMKYNVFRGGGLAIAQVCERLAHLGRRPHATVNMRAHLDSIFDLPEEYQGWDLSHRLDWQLEHSLPMMVDWITDWLKIIDTPNSGFHILLTTYRELKENPEAFFARILDFYDITGKQVTLPQLEKGQLHFRKGETDEWRQVFTPAQIECAGKSIPEYLRERFLWPAH